MIVQGLCRVGRVQSNLVHSGEQPVPLLLLVSLFNVYWAAHEGIARTV